MSVLAYLCIVQYVLAALGTFMVSSFAFTLGGTTPPNGKDIGMVLLSTFFWPVAVIFLLVKTSRYLRNKNV